VAMGDRSVVLEGIRTLFGVGTAVGLSDRQLLARFATGDRGQAELAFGTLVDRHGPMVLRVCRDALRDTHDADDAFQATFLVLARRSGSIRRPEALGAWLHGVAQRITASLRVGAARRRRHEQSRGETVAGSPDPADDAAPILHDEVSRLPPRHREAVVLCYFQGLTHEEAAARLGWPVGTVHSRLAWARERLKSRLTRRGLAPSAVIVGASVPASLARATVDHAFRGAGGSVPSAVVTLANAVLRTFFMTKITLIAVGVAAAGLIVAVGGQVSGAQKPERKPVAASRLTVPITGPRGEVAAEPHRSVDSASILRARLEFAIRQRALKEQMVQNAAISTAEADESRFEVSLIAAQIESQRDDLRDELERLEAELEIRKANLDATVAMAESAQQFVIDQGSTLGEGLARREHAVQKAQIPLRQAEVSEIKIRINQVRRRLVAIEPLVDLARKSTATTPNPAPTPAPAPPASR
jgi:RNA polymerase sigma factor (sigma-70 family)